MERDMDIELCTEYGKPVLRWIKKDYWLCDIWILPHMRVAYSGKGANAEEAIAMALENATKKITRGPNNK